MWIENTSEKEIPLERCLQFCFFNDIQMLFKYIISGNNRYSCKYLFNVLTGRFFSLKIKINISSVDAVLLSLFTLECLLRKTVNLRSLIPMESKDTVIEIAYFKLAFFSIYFIFAHHFGT